MQITKKFVDVNYYDDSNYDYVLTKEWECPADVPRSLWEYSPDGKHVLREAITERKNEIPARKQWENRLKLKFKMDSKTARLMSYCVEYIAGNYLSYKMREFWEDWIAKEGLQKVWKETRRMFWALYHERLKKPPARLPVVLADDDNNLCNCTSMWVPLPLKEDDDFWRLSKGYIVRVEQLRRFSRSLLELKLLKKLFYLKSQILRSQIKQLQQKIEKEKDRNQKRKLQRILQQRKKALIPFWEEKILWNLVRKRQEEVYRVAQKSRPQIRKAIKEFVRLASSGNIEELKERTVKFCRAYKKFHGRAPIYFYRALYLAFWLNKLQRMIL